MVIAADPRISGARVKVAAPPPPHPAPRTAPHRAAVYVSLLDPDVAIYCASLEYH